MQILLKLVSDVFSILWMMLLRIFRSSTKQQQKNNNTIIIDDFDDVDIVKATGAQNGKSEESSNVAQVYILLGQSNMLGMGHVHGRDQDGTLECAVFKKNLYPYLINNNDWATSKSVRNVRVMDGKGSNGMAVYNNEFMTVKKCDRIGPEFGIGHILEQAASRRNSKSSKIMLLKSCIGNRSLGWDLLPPGSRSYTYKDKMYAGYGESPANWDKDSPKPTPKPDAWYAGKQYDSDIAHAKRVLADLPNYYPGATSYEVRGFFWWQGDKDRYTEAYAEMYEKNFMRLIQQLRKEFDCPRAKFVLATLGQDEINNCKGNDKLILDAMLNVDGASGKHPENVGNVSTVYAHPLSKGGASNSHYNGNAETYMNIGQAMGQAMVELIPNKAASKTEMEMQASNENSTSTSMDDVV